MLKKLAATVKKVGKTLPPQRAKSFGDVVALFREEGVVSVIAEITTYKMLFAGRHRIAIDYIGVGKEGQEIRRQEVLEVIKEKVSDDHLVSEMRKFYPHVRDRVNRLRTGLGAVVTIPEHVVKALTITNSRQPGANT